LGHAGDAFRGAFGLTPAAIRHDQRDWSRIVVQQFLCERARAFARVEQQYAAILLVQWGQIHPHIGATVDVQLAVGQHIQREPSCRGGLGHLAAVHHQHEARRQFQGCD
jgi:hypothetical protein